MDELILTDQENVRENLVHIFDLEKVRQIVTDLEIQVSEEKLQALHDALGRYYREFLRDGMSFDEFKKYSQNDIEQYREAFDSNILHIFGTIPTFTVGFHFSLPCKEDTEDRDYEIPEDEKEEYVKAMIDTFDPIEIYAGTPYMEQQLLEMGYTSTLCTWFEQGGFMVVLKTPYPMCRGPDESRMNK